MGESLVCFYAKTSNKGFYVVFMHMFPNSVGLIVAELKQGRDLNREDRDLLCDSQLKYTSAYILSLGVVDSSRYGYFVKVV